MFANFVRRQALTTRHSLPRHSFRRLASTSSTSSAESSASTFATTFKYLRYLSVVSSVLAAPAQDFHFGGGNQANKGGNDEQCAVSFRVLTRHVRVG